jgi:hypothetical protein
MLVTLIWKISFLANHTQCELFVMLRVHVQTQYFNVESHAQHSLHLCRCSAPLYQEARLLREIRKSQSRFEGKYDVG